MDKVHVQQLYVKKKKNYKILVEVFEANGHFLQNIIHLTKGKLIYRRQYFT